MPDLSDRFAEEQSNVIEWCGIPIHGLYEFESIPRSITLEYISAKEQPVQGIQLRMRGGTMTVNDTDSGDIVLWNDTAPARVEIEIRTKPKGRTSLKLWNVWRGGQGVTQAWLGNAAIRVQDEPSGRTVLHCSDGQGEPDFDDLVVAVTAQ
jgi:hypothetical protein